MDYELYHHGILGMKWGIRRYQNPDGTLTEAGKRRYYHDMNSVSDEDKQAYIKKKNLDDAYRKALGKTPIQKEIDSLNTTKASLNSASKVISDLKKKNAEKIAASKTREKLDLSNMTDQELRDRINRVNLEEQYSRMFAEEKTNISKGQAFASKALEVAGTVTAVGTTAVGLAIMFKELEKKAAGA